MFDDIYKSLQSHIEPSEDLINDTKRRMRIAAQKSKKMIPMYRYCAVAACLLLVISGLKVWPFISNAPVNKTIGLDTIDSSTPALSDHISSITEGGENSPHNDILETNDLIESNVIDRMKQVGEQISYDNNNFFNEAEFSQLIPKYIPESYKFESGYKRILDGGVQEWFTFTKGYDYISLQIRPIDLENDKVRFVSIDDEESYDITRYTIPLAETIPERLSNTVRNPIFNSDDLTKQAISLRAFASSGQGEGNRYKLQFGIKCNDYLVDYNIRTDDISFVYEMVTSADFYENVEM